MKKEIEMLSQQEIAEVVGISRSTMSRTVKKFNWRPTLDRRNNHAKCYPLKQVADHFKLTQSELKKRVRKLRVELGHHPSRKLFIEL